MDRLFWVPVSFFYLFRTWKYLSFLVRNLLFEGAPTFQVQNVSFRQGVYIHTIFFSGLDTVPWFGWCAIVRWILVLGRFVFRFFRSMDANGVGFCWHGVLEASTFELGYIGVNHLLTFVGHPSRLCHEYLNDIVLFWLDHPQNQGVIYNDSWELKGSPLQKPWRDYKTPFVS